MTSLLYSQRPRDWHGRYLPEDLKTCYERHVIRRGSNECWGWKGRLYDFGYGQLNFQRKCWRAHRVSWVLQFGDIPDGLDVLHTCDNPVCSNPAHLFLGTHQENMRDCARKGRLKLVHHCGEKHGNAKLTETDVRTIRSLYSEGHTSTRELAKQFGMTQSPIVSIIQRKAWRHVK